MFVEKNEKERRSSGAPGSGGQEIEGIGSAIQRCLVEIGLASNAPVGVKCLVSDSVFFPP